MGRHASYETKPLTQEQINEIVSHIPPASANLTLEQINTIVSLIPPVDISGKVDKITNYSLVLNTEIAKIHASGSENQDISGKVDKIINYSLVANTEISKIHSPGSDNQDLSGLQPKETGKGLYPDADSIKLAGIATNANNYSHPASHSPSIITQDVSNRFVSDVEKSTWNGKEPGNANIQTHVTAAHAPITAQANADITKEEIEAKLTGSIATHSHTITYPAFNSVYRTILDSTGSHIATKVAGIYGIPQGNPLAVTGVGTLYSLNVIYIDSADYPTIDGKTTKLRVRCVIECNDVAPFTGTFTVGLHPVTRPATSGGAGVCIYTIGTAVTGSTVVGTNLAADSQNNLVGTDFALPANGFYVLAVVTSATMATSSHVHVSANLQIRNA
jgi:hypothetical protein